MKYQTKYEYYNVLNKSGKQFLSECPSNWPRRVNITPLRVVGREASEFAREAHRGQMRKYNDEPYINHPQRVSTILFDFGYGDNGLDEEHTRGVVMQAAAMLHDVVEDCEVPHKEIYGRFGDEIGDLVFWLTDISRPGDGNRKIRKHLDRLHMWGGPLDAQLIKCADCIDNSRDIIVQDPNFARVYVHEIRDLLVGMREETKEKLIWQEAMSYVQ